jgi:hypothetical protein
MERQQEETAFFPATPVFFGIERWSGRSTTNSRILDDSWNFEAGLP